MIMPTAHHICVIEGCPDQQAPLTVFCARHHAQLPASRQQKITYWYKRAVMHVPDARLRFREIIEGTLPLFRTLDMLACMRAQQRKD